ncbi:SEC-C domain-containing protein [Kineosporia rhizophila]|uniref:DUF5926 family protein n=1 Tax=Kineosporia TaxID=49184 RepID=UPI001E5B88A1|nr:MULTISPECIES: DUF5926 family protein [Kineosporia]MCE0536949.1 SEC-C domain-containing protein [Kineosporia rhizophila]GLY19105.1 preprotein translocase SecA [Kineosporia sp. NBRC 101677]
MGKKQRRTGSAPVAVADGDIPVVGGREACPCGSGKRYKACHGRAARIEAMKMVVRPFEGLTGECDLVAMREIVPAATAVVPVKEEFGGGEVTIATILPMAWSALHRADGTVLVGLQTNGGSGDASRDIAAALLSARELEAGNPVAEGDLPGPGPRLQDVLDLSGGFDVAVHEGFDFWFAQDNELTPEVRESLEQANGAAVPTKRLNSVDAAYWVQMGARRHLRWVLPDDETKVLDGIARLHAAGESALLPETKYVGSFRACGLIVPVWDLADDTEPEELEKPIVAFAERLREAMGRTEPLTPDERRARAGVVSRQVTLR